MQTNLVPSGIIIAQHNGIPNCMLVAMLSEVADVAGNEVPGNDTIEVGCGDARRGYIGLA
jgi:hypothetical protein